MAIMDRPMVKTIPNETGAPLKVWYVEHRRIGQDWAGEWCVVKSATKEEISALCARYNRVMVRAEEV